MSCEFCDGLGVVVASEVTDSYKEKDMCGEEDLTLCLVVEDRKVFAVYDEFSGDEVYICPECDGLCK